MAARDLPDTRYHLLSSAIRRMHSRLDPDEIIIGLTLVTMSSSNEMLTTIVLADGKMQRRLVTDESTMVRVSGDLTRESTVVLDTFDED